MKMSPLQMCHDGSYWASDGGARFDCLGMAKKLNARNTHRARMRSPRLVVMVQRRWSRGGMMGRHHRGGIRMEMSATQSKQDTWKDFMAAGVRLISLWRVLTQET